MGIFENVDSKVEVLFPSFLFFFSFHSCMGVYFVSELKEQVYDGSLGNFFKK